eukprot:TRINITY_DN62545_c0_g1_i1.p1 TRINITY_DN62545_c0_g1~~TRINITY_DN62545_c0_g1_i1.p1  ORF type:complete len:122 (+),score=9.22 TRINITY_DN62545_c0_g1_i1:139-504(+)
MEQEQLESHLHPGENPAPYSPLQHYHAIRQSAHTLDELRHANECAIAPVVPPLSPPRSPTLIIPQSAHALDELRHASECVIAPVVPPLSPPRSPTLIHPSSGIPHSPSELRYISALDYRTD